MSTSIGYTNPVSGGNFTNILNVAKNGRNHRPVLGGGIRGFIAQALNDTDNNDAFAQNRFILRNAWNNVYKSQLARGHVQRVCTPFRAVTNSGDLLAREWIYYSCGGPCQSFQSRPNMKGLRTHFGAIQGGCDNTGVPAAACNTKYVYDSSDYVTYLKQKATGKNYNAVTNGGDHSNASQHAIRAIRRY
jgi:hypothetical protein